MAKKEYKALLNELNGHSVKLLTAIKEHIKAKTKPLTVTVDLGEFEKDKSKIDAIRALFNGGAFGDFADTLLRATEELTGIPYDILNVGDGVKPQVGVAVKVIGNVQGHSYGDGIVILCNEGRSGHLFLTGESTLAPGDTFGVNRKQYLSEKEVRPATDQEIDELFDKLKPNGITHVVKLMQELSLA